MAEGPFQVVFRGETTGEHSVETVKQQLASLFRMSAERVEALFSGKPVVVKKNVDETTARRLEQAFSRAGAVCEVRAPNTGGAGGPATAEAPGGAADEEPGTGPSATENGRADDASRAAAQRTGSIAAAGDPNRTVVNLAVPDSYGDLAIDESEAPLSDPARPQAPAIDTSELSLADADAGPLDQQTAPPPADIDTSGLEMERIDDED